MSIKDIRAIQRLGYTDYTTQDEDFFKNVDPSFEGYKNYGVVADNRNAVSEAVEQAGGYYEAPDTSKQDLTTIGALGTAAVNYGKWEPYASSLLKKGFPNASFAKAKIVDGVTTYGASGSSSVIGSAASQYYGNLTGGTAAGVGTGLGTALVGYGIKKAFGDDDPTTYTAPEQIGSAVQGAGTGAAIASALTVAGPVGIIAGALLGWRAGKKRQKEAIKQATEQRARDIAQAYQDNRTNFSQIAKEEQYYKDRAMFENPYGIEARSQDTYVPSYAHGGYHFNYQGLFGSPGQSILNSMSFGIPGTGITPPGVTSPSTTTTNSGSVPLLGTGTSTGSVSAGGSPTTSPTTPPSTTTAFVPPSGTPPPYSGDPAGESPPTGPYSPYTPPPPPNNPRPGTTMAITRDNRTNIGYGYPGGYQQYIAGAILPQGPIINQGEFMSALAGGSQTSTDERTGAGDTGNFLQRAKSDESDNFYRRGDKGMKVAEVTGNEVIMPAERQNKIEKALASGDTETPGKIMKQTIAEGKVTKGAASHDSNPMPIMSSGAVLDKNGKDTGLKADSGAGIYHQATKQFKNNMSNKQISKAIRKNIASWKKQGKA